jgi:hypothetical protein
VEWITGKGINLPQVLRLGPEDDDLESSPIIPGGPPFTWLFTTSGIFSYRSQVRANPFPLHHPRGKSVILFFSCRLEDFRISGCWRTAREAGA